MTKMQDFKKYYHEYLDKNNQEVNWMCLAFVLHCQETFLASK